MSVDFCGIRIRVGFTAAVFLACIANQGNWITILTGIGSVFLHEMTHLIFMERFGCRHATVDVLPGGVRIRCPEFDAMGSRQAMICLISAPVVNLTAALLLYLFSRRCFQEYLFQAAILNLTLGAVNLLPLSFLDGGRALYLLISIRYPVNGTERISFVIDVTLLVLMTAAAFVLICLRVISFHYYFFVAYCFLAVLTSHKKNG